MCSSNCEYTYWKDCHLFDLQQNDKWQIFVVTVLHLVLFTRSWAGGLIQVSRGKELRIEWLRIGKIIRAVILPGTRMWKLDSFAVPVIL